MARFSLVAVVALSLAVPSARADDENASASPPTEQGAPPAAAPAQPTPSPPAAQQPVAQGQWVWTQQYGWIWMPYGPEYTYVPPDGYGEPYAYVYYPVHGWTWVAAPWVWGWGSWPWFGAYGPWRFAWYAQGHWRHPWLWHYGPGRGYHGAYVGYGYHGAHGFHGPGIHGWQGFHGVLGAPARGAFGPAPRAFAGRGGPGGWAGHGRR